MTIKLITVRPFLPYVGLSLILRNKQWSVNITTISSHKNLHCSQCPLVIQPRFQAIQSGYNSMLFSLHTYSFTIQTSRFIGNSAHRSNHSQKWMKYFWPNFGQIKDLAKFITTYALHNTYEN